MNWERIEIILQGVQAVDSTIFKYNGKYWLFTNIVENDGAPISDELFLFYSDTLLNGTWIPHPLNPIISDVKYARSARNVFIYRGRVYRPSQNCSVHYGYGMQIREILKLTKLEYEERQVQSIHPNWERDLISTHTLNTDHKITVIDALTKRNKYF